MDNRDSSGSPAAVAGRDGSTEEDGLLSATAGLAKEAAVLFQSRRYPECIDVLKQLLQKKEGDPKVLLMLPATCLDWGIRIYTLPMMFRLMVHHLHHFLVSFTVIHGVAGEPDVLLWNF